MTHHSLEDQTEAIERAAVAIRDADALIIAAGAGMGVDSGLPDFRGPEGFWRAYPAYAELGLSFRELANPRWFREDPALAWGFYGHRLRLYRETDPHEGFAILRGWAERMPLGHFVYTSNVDGHFQKAGYDPDRVCEVHGSLNHLQCLNDCGIGIIDAGPFQIDANLKTFRARPPLPQCPRCRFLMRPNVLMFGDMDWDLERSHQQERRLADWLRGLDQTANLTIVECGAGEAVPTVRDFSETLVGRKRARLIRLNPRDPGVPQGEIGLAIGALDGLEAIRSRLEAWEES